MISTSINSVLIDFFCDFVGSFAVPFWVSTSLNLLLGFSVLLLLLVVVLY